MIHIRKAIASDHSEISVLAEEIARQHHAHSPHVFAAPPGIERDRALWRSCIEMTNGVMLVAHHGEELVGFISAELFPQNGITFLKPRVLCHVNTLVVTETMKHKGIGKLLMTATEEWAQSAGADEIRLEVFDKNNDAMEFYRRVGYALQSHIMTKEIS